MCFPWPEGTHEREWDPSRKALGQKKYQKDEQGTAPDKGMVGDSLMGRILQIAQMCPTSCIHLLNQWVSAHTTN